jgi:hypothetical protein
VEFILTALALLAFGVSDNAVHLALYVLHAAVAGWLAWRLVKRQPLTAMFIVVYVGMYFPNPISIMAGWIPPDSSQSILFRSNALVLLGLDLFLIGARRLRLTRWDANRMPRMVISASSVEIVILIIFAVTAGAMFALVLAGREIGVDVFRVSKQFRATGGADTSYLSAAYCNMLLPLAVFLVGLKRLAAQGPYLVVVLALLVLNFFIFRIRTVPLAALIAYGVALAVRARFVALTGQPVRWRVPLWVRAALLAGIPLLVAAGIGIKYLRYGHATGKYGYERARFQAIMQDTFAGGDLGYTFFLRQALRYFPANHAFLNGQSYYRLLFVPIPRAVWPGKPLNTQRIFAGVLNPGFYRTGVTIPAGIVGDLYINFGTVGVLGMLVFGAVFAQEKYRRLTDVLFLSAASMWLFHLCRGGFTNPIVTALVTWAAAGLCTRFVRHASVRVPDARTDAHQFRDGPARATVPELGRPA